LLAVKKFAPPASALRRALSCPPVRLAACRLGTRRPVGFALIGLPRLGTGNGSSQAVKHVPHAMQKILDHEGGFHMRERYLLDSIKVQAEVGRRRMSVDQRDAKTDKRMHLPGEETHVFGFPGISHQSLPCGERERLNLKPEVPSKAVQHELRIINASDASVFRT
jgi:hypothetical protein